MSELLAAGFEMLGGLSGTVLLEHGSARNS
jgi:hypothetical protein